MKLFTAKTIVFMCCLLLSSVTASAEETLTNRSVERMVAAGLSPGIITSKIKATKNNFDVSTDTILQLKKNGINDDIIQAMVEAGGNQNLAPQPGDRHEPNGPYYEPGQRYDPTPSTSGPYQSQQRIDPNAKLLKDIAEAATLKEKRDYTWKTKAHTIAVTLKSIYPSNTHNIKYWWAYTQYSVLVEKEHHILKGIKKVLYFDANHQDALILKGDTYFAQAKRMHPNDEGRLGSSREDVADDAQQAYRTALGLPKISTAKKSKIYYQLGEIAKEIDKNKTRAQQNWQKAMDEEPQGHWGRLAADRLGVIPPQSSQDQFQPSVASSLNE